MRLFFIEWAGKKFGMVDIVLELKKQGHEIIYWSGPNLDNEVEKEKFPDTIFHDHFDALFARPAPEIDASGFPPPGETLIKSMAAAESETITMMSKLFEKMQVNERKHLYYNYLRYWNGVIQKFNPDAIIFPNVPHTVYDFVLYSLAKKFKIKTILFELTRINDRSLAENFFEEGSEALRGEIKKNQGKDFSVADLQPDIRNYYESQLKAAKPTPKDIVEIAGKYSGLKSIRVKARSFWTTLTVLKDFSVFSKIATYLPRKFMDNQIKEYRRFETPPDFSKKYVYATLQMQPEATTSPMGGIYVDQLLMVEALAASLPEDWLIYVKEHPLQWKPRGKDFFSYRYRGYYEAMAKLKNVRIAPASTDSFQLIRNAECVASTSGTAGWEALLRGKPSLIFGYAWYRDCPGVFNVRDSEACKKALEEIKNGADIRPQEIINYLASFGKIAMNGFREQYCMDVSPITKGESVANHIRAINSMLNRE